MAQIPEPMAPAAGQPLFTIEENTELIWPANPPDAPEFKEQEPPEQPAASIGIRDE
ncbi:hypothetical protein FVEN_g12790 [Fusarium venenatum]|nr:hypothetical protein FVEN_g12790 [Fusarium venenatum]